MQPAGETAVNSPQRHRPETLQQYRRPCWRQHYFLGLFLNVFIGRLHEGIVIPKEVLYLKSSNDIRRGGILCRLNFIHRGNIKTYW